jgi:hypothetical protein
MFSVDLNAVYNNNWAREESGDIMDPPTLADGVTPDPERGPNTSHRMCCKWAALYDPAAAAASSGTMSGGGAQKPAGYVKLSVVVLKDGSPRAMPLIKDRHVPLERGDLKDMVR